MLSQPRKIRTYDAEDVVELLNSDDQGFTVCDLVEIR